MKNLKTLFAGNKHLIVCVLVYIIYAIVTFVIGLYHEPWADEAQSWLIARDCSFYDIIFERCSYEGTPFLWFYILKIFILAGWSYEYLFVISWLFSCIGIYLFLFKSKFPNIIKILVPFTYYIFYQYAIIARSYSLILPLLCIMAILFKNRFKNTPLYCLSIILFASVCSYTTVISFILLTFLFYELYIQNKDNSKYFFEIIIPVILVFIYIFFLCLLLKKPNDCFFPAIIHFNKFFNNFIAVTTNTYFNVIKLREIYFIFILFFYFMIMFALCKNIKQILFFIIINFTPICLMSILYNQPWHYGITVLTLLFYCWTLIEENNKKTISLKAKNILYLLLFIIFIIQILWSISSSYLEIKLNYCGSKDVARFIKHNKLTEKNIIGIGYNIVAIQPYFKKNIFSNVETTYWSWDIKSFQKYQTSINENIKKNIANLIILSWSTNLSNFEGVIYFFDAELILQGKINRKNDFKLIKIKEN